MFSFTDSVIRDENMKKIYSLSYFECKKLFVTKSIIVIISLFYVLNIFNIFKNNFSNNNSLIEIGRYELYTVYKGELGNEKLEEMKLFSDYAEQLSASGNYSTEYCPEKYYSGYAYGEAMLRIDLYREAIRIKEYERYSQNISENATELLKNSEISSYYRNINVNLAEIYGNRNLSRLTNNSGITNFLSYRLSDLLCVVLVVISAVTIFTSDEENKTLLFVKSSTNGGRITTVAKFISSAFFTLIICTVFFATDFITFSAIFRIDGLTEPLYSLKEFADSPLNISIWQYVLIYFLSKLTGFSCIAFLTALLSLLLQKALPSTLCSMTLVAAFMYLKAFITVSPFEKVNLLNPLSLILLPEMSVKYDVILFGDKPIFTLFVSFAVIITVMLIVFVIAIIKGGRNVKV